MQNEPSFVSTRHRGNPRTTVRTPWADGFLALYTASIRAQEQDYFAANPQGIAFLPQSEVSALSMQAEGEDYFASPYRKIGDAQAIVQLIYLLGYELQRQDYIALCLPNIIRILAGRAGFKRSNESAQELVTQALEKGRNTWVQFHPIPAGIQSAFKTQYTDPFEEFISEKLGMEGI